ncbi:dihydrodipicolinate synthase [Candidatus Vecturithrix granuli]|uniref:Dihydrodipicolinate synthase n=1 Tax=Vecturithrix granuli TaxID=1499967 RepID=A0A0S6WBH7_VECG1|nr:dihydrodipicolinate synthase [Candidatus Vecturithrix granuli]
MIQGSLVPNITIFDEHGSIDREKTGWHIRWMFEKGLDGLFLTGSYGAGPMMTTEERIGIFKLAKEAASEFSGKFLLPHVGCIDTKSTVELAKAADTIGVDAIGAVPPFYYKHEEKLIIQYYKEIIESVNTPVYAYNNPETSRFTFSFNTVLKLQELGLKGLKDSPLNVGFLSRVNYDAKVNKKDFQIIIGTSTGWLPFYYMGVRATIGGMNNWAPEIMTEMIKATFEGNMERAERAYLVMLDLSAKMHFTDSTIASHIALYARGFNAGFPRKPMMLPPFDDQKYKEIRGWLARGFETLGLEMETGNDSPIKD